MHGLGIDRVGELRVQQANIGSPGRMAVKTKCVCQPSVMHYVILCLVQLCVIVI